VLLGKYKKAGLGHALHEMLPSSDILGLTARNIDPDHLRSAGASRPLLCARLSLT
jgi:hypothetical protein